MSGWESFVITISLGVIALAIVILTVFLAITLVSLCRTLKTTREIGEDVEEKIHAFDPLFRILHRLGLFAEYVARPLEKYEHEEDDEEEEEAPSVGCDIATFAMLGASIWQRLRRR